MGNLLELTNLAPIALPSGESRLFLEDGDQVILSGFARAPNRTSIGFGDCRATLLPAYRSQ
jgi:fumarylacetoacetase